MKYIIDRIENDIVICENQETKKMESFPKNMFQENIKDGDVVIKDGNFFKVDEQETLDRKKHIEDLMKKLMK